MDKIPPTVSVLPYASATVPLLDIHRDNGPIRDEILDAIAAVFDSGRFLHGPDVSAVEKQVAEICGVPHAVGCASGSDALLLALMAAEIGPGDEVIVPSFTFFATASAVWRLGAKIVFADIDPVTFNLDPERVAERITPRTRAVIPVHLFGQCAPMDRFMDLAGKHNLIVVEDAAQAIGASYQGRAAGAWGQVGCFSFYPTKNLGGCGDGGLMTTNESEWEDKLRLYAAHGMKPRYLHRVVGINSRLDTMQAAALRIKLPQLSKWTDQRRLNAERYAAFFKESGLEQVVTLPTESPHCHHVWNQYTIRVPYGQRDALRAHLSASDVGSEVYYPCPLHLQACFQDVGCEKGELPVTEVAASEVLSLPIFPGLTAEEQRVVVGRIGEFFVAQRASAA